MTPSPYSCIIHKLTIQGKEGKMSKLTILIIGVLIGIALPFMVDMVLFGDPTPCSTIKVYEDGSSIQGCGTRG